MLKLPAACILIQLVAIRENAAAPTDECCICVLLMLMSLLFTDDLYYYKKNYSDYTFARLLVLSLSMESKYLGEIECCEA
jgi:hypothetical protein